MKEEPFEPKNEPFLPNVKNEPFQVKNEPLEDRSIKEESSINVKQEAETLESDTESVSSSISSTDERTRCPICLCSYKDQNSAKPDVCEHRFCLECIEEWSKKTNTCPIDRKTYRSIIANIYDSNTREVKTKRIAVEDRSQQAQYDTGDLTFCEVCRRSDREDRMLLCDGCDNGYHCECLQPAIDLIPEGQWFCSDCQEARTNSRTRLRRVRPTTAERLNNITAEAERLLSELHSNDSNEINMNEINELMVNVVPSTSRARNRQTITIIRPIARTRFMERVRHSVNENRIQRGSYIIETEDEDDESSGSESEPNNGHEAACSCIMCDESCKVDLTNVARPGRKKIIRRRKRKQTKRSGGKYKRGRTKRRRKVYKRSCTATGAVSTQAKIIKSIQSAQQRQNDIERSSSQCPITLTSIELELMKQPDKQSRKQPRFPGTTSQWHANSLLSEIDETDRSFPLSSMSLLDTEPKLFSNNSQLSSKQVASTASPSKASTSLKSSKSTESGATDFLSSILNSQKVLLAPSNKIKVQRDGSLHLKESITQHKQSPLKSHPSLSRSSSSLSSKHSFPKMIDTSGTVDPTVKSELITKQEDENNAYDPFNPDDSPEETPKQIKFGIKSTIKSEKPAKITPLGDSPLNNINDTEKTPKIKSESQPADKLIKTEPELVKKPKSEPKETESNIKKEESSSKKPLASKSTDKKRHRSRSPQLKKQKSKTRSKSRSPRRRSNDKSSRSHGSRRSRSSSNRRSIERRDRNRSERDRKSRESYKSKRSRSKSPTGKISYSSNSSKYAPPKVRDLTNEHRRDRSDHSHRNERYDRHKSDQKGNTSELYKSETSKSQVASSAATNKEQKYSDYLIEEMINEEKQQIIDINNISLPPADNKQKQTSSSANSGSKNNKSNAPDGSKTYLDKRLDLIFGGSSEKSSSESKEEKEKLVKKVNEHSEAEKKNKESEAKAAKLNKPQSKNGTNKTNDKKSQSNSILDTQEKIVDAAKMALKPHFISNQVSKEDYKTIMRKVVTKALHCKKTGGLVDRHRVSKMVAEHLKASDQSAK